MRLDLDRRGRDLFLAGAWALALVGLGTFTRGFFAPANLRDIVITGAPMLIAAVGMSRLVAAGQIDLSIGAQLAVGAAAGAGLAQGGVPMPLVGVALPILGAVMGAVNGLLVGKAGVPSMFATLATTFALRIIFHVATKGRDISSLPPDFQWMGLPVWAGRAFAVVAAAGLFTAAAFSCWGRHPIFDPRRKHGVFASFALVGGLTGIASFLTAIRFPQVEATTGVGFELAVIAAALAGGSMHRNDRDSLVGTLLAVLVITTLGASVTFLPVIARWEQAALGAMILLALLARSSAKGAYRGDRENAAA